MGRSPCTNVLINIKKKLVLLTFFQRKKENNVELKLERYILIVCNSHTCTIISINFLKSEWIYSQINI